MDIPVKSLGIIGAGKLGIVLAQLAVKAGYTVYISGSGPASKIALTVSVLAPGAIAITTEEVLERADVIILALPLGKYAELPASRLKGKLVIDAMNYWWEIDGDRPDLTSPNITSSEVVQQFLVGSQVVKAFNHVGYHDLDNEALPVGSSNRKGIAVAGNESASVAAVATIVDDLGFDPVIIGDLSKSQVLQPGGPVFGEHVSAEKLKHMIKNFGIIE
jgi:predicted dinucleotide-binding enzyme